MDTTTDSHATAAESAEDDRPPRPPYQFDESAVRANVPQIMQLTPQWLYWRYEWDEAKRKWVKRPKRPTRDVNGSSTDPTSRGTFDAAIAAVERFGYSGIGFVFTPEDEFIGIDLDDCFQPSGAMKPWAKELLDEVNTYTERSPGDGAKSIAFASYPKGYAKQRKPFHIDEPETELMVAPEGKYWTITGNRIDDYSYDVEHRQDVITRWTTDGVLMREGPKAKAKVAAATDRPAPSGSSLSDDEILTKCASAKNAAKFIKLFDNGDASTYGNDLSAADAALAGLFAFYSDDTEQVARLMRRSALNREKFDRSDYLPRTIAKVFARTSKRWEPKANRRRNRSTRPVSVVSDAAEAVADEVTGVSDREMEREQADAAMLAFEASELRQAQVVNERHGHDLRFNVDSGRFAVFNGVCWQNDELGLVDNYVKTCAMEADARLLGKGFEGGELEKILKSLQSARGITAVKKILQSEPGLPARAAAFDADRYALNARNGTVDLRTGELRPHRREDLITKALDCEYDLHAPAPLWCQHVRRITGGDTSLMRYLQKIAGLCASGDIGIQEFFVFFGKGANGKSAFLDTLRFVLRPFASIAPESLLIARSHGAEHPTELAGLMGKRLVIASETEEGGTLRLQLIKRLTGDETITARFMRQDFFEFPRTHKMILQTNNKPKITENSEATWRRIRLVPFTVTIPVAERDPHFADKLKAEAAGILAWIVEGSRMRLAEGMEPPAAVQRATDGYRESSDTFPDFMAAEFVLASGLRVARSDVMKVYDVWRRAQGEDPLPNGAVYERVRNFANGVDESKWKEAGQTARGFTGIGLRWQNGGHGDVAA